MRYLRAGENVVWDNRGSVTIDGVVVPGANIIDLVNDAMRDRKRSTPIGHLQFATALRNTAIPREFIGSQRVWKEVITIPANSRTPEGHRAPTIFQTPPETYRTTTTPQPSSSTSSGGEADSDSIRKRKKVSPAKRQSWIWTQMSGLK